MKKKLVLIDGSSVLSKNFYGTLPWEYKKAKTLEEKVKAIRKAMKTKDGQYTNGVFGMMKFLLKVIEEQEPTHMVVAWDINRNTFRREIYPEYKGTRKETPEELKSQFILSQQLLDACGIYQGMVEGEFLEQFEADDVVGTFAKKFENDIPTYIITGDQDSLQLITDKTKVWLTTSKAEKLYEKRNINIKELNIPTGTFEFCPQTFEEEYGIKPLQIIDLKALEGDTSDNIPGVVGVGKTSAPKLIQMFGSVENLYENIEGLTKEELETVKTKLKEIGISRPPLKPLLKETENELVGKKSALLSKKLATIVTNIKEYNDIQLEDLEIKLNKENMKQKFIELEFKSLIEKI